MKRPAPALLLVAAGLAAAQPAPPAAVDVARLFVAGCLRNQGQAGAVVDWALARGFALPDAQRELPPLLDGAAGSVLVMPDSGGNVLIAAADDGRCVVWAEQQPGPALRLALERELDALAASGSRVKIESDRNLQHAGQWRNVRMWRVRPLAAAGELQVGAVTSLGAVPAAQALNLTPAPAIPTDAAAPR